MGIKLDPIKRTYTVSYSKRKTGVNQMPVSLTRTGFKTEREAKQAFNNLVIEVEMRIKAKIVPTWSKIVEDFERASSERGLTRKTIDGQITTLRGHTFEVWADKLVTDITRTEIHRQFIAKVGHSSQANQQYVLKCIRLAFEFAVDSGFIPANPTPKIHFRAGDKIRKVLTAEQVGRLLNMARELDHQWYPHWAFASYTGMRNGELYALTWNKVDLDKNLILVDSAWNSKDGFKSTKSGDDRLVEIAPGLLPVIRDLKRQSIGLDFVLPRVHLWDHGDQARALRLFLAGMGLPVVRFHDLRATWATILLSKGIEPIKVMKMGGWKDMKTMMIYVRKAGIDISGAMSGFTLHEPTNRVATVLEFGLRS
jgi:integrase